MTRARALLEQAKGQVRGKHALAVGYVRRSGTGEASIQPWVAREGTSAEAFGVFARGVANRLSPRLVSDLDRDAGELARLSAANPRLYRAELARLVARHTEAGVGSSDAVGTAAEALAWLGMNEAAQRPAPGSPEQRPQRAARVGVFLRQEAR